MNLTGYARQVSYNTIGNIVTLFAQWLIIMIIPKITDFSEAGVFAVAVSVASIINQISTFTLNQYQVADGYDRFSENDYSLTRLITIAISLFCIIPITFIFGYGWTQFLVIFAYSVYRSLINYAMLQQSALQLLNHLDYAGKSMVIEGILSFTVFITIYMVSSNLFLATLSMAAVGGGIYLLLLLKGYEEYMGQKYKVSFKFSGNEKSLLIIGLPMMVSTLAPIIITALSKLILENEWGTEVVGIFSTLTSPTIIVPTLATAVFIPFIGKFSKICKAGNLRELRIVYSKFVVVLSGLCVVCYGISILFAEPVFVMIYGEDIGAYVKYFHLLVVGIFFYSVGICGITVLITKNQGHIAGVASVITMLFSVILFVSWIPSGGMDGATWGLMWAYGAFGALVSLCVYLIPLKQFPNQNNSCDSV